MLFGICVYLLVKLLSCLFVVKHKCTFNGFTTILCNILPKLQTSEAGNEHVAAAQDRRSECVSVQLIN